MKTMKIKIEVTIYEVNGEDKSGDDVLEIESHWNKDELVVIKFGKKSLTIRADELTEAIQRCSGWQK